MGNPDQASICAPSLFGSRPIETDSCITGIDAQSLNDAFPSVGRQA